MSHTFKNDRATIGARLPVQGCGAGSSSERTRSAITAALRKKLKDLMGEFQELRQRLQDEYRRASPQYSAQGSGIRDQPQGPPKVHTHL